MTDDKSGDRSFRVLFGEKFVICHSVLAGASGLPPFVLWIFALQFQFQFGIRFPPKRREFLGDLNGTIVRSEHVDEH